MTTLAGAARLAGIRPGHIAAAALFIVLPIVAFAEIAVEISKRDETGWDDSLIPSLVHVRAWWADAVMTAVSIVGGGRGLLLVASGATGFLFAEGRRFDAAFLLLSIIGASVLSRTFKDLFDRPRPGVARSVIGMSMGALVIVALVLFGLAIWKWPRTGIFMMGAFGILLATSGLLDLWRLAPHRDSFPSGHAVGSMAAVGALIVIAWSTRWRARVIVYGLLFVAAVGLSRVYFGVHYTSDVLAGWCLSVTWVALLGIGRAVYLRKRGAGPGVGPAEQKA